MALKPKNTARAENIWIALVTGSTTFPGGSMWVFSSERMIAASAARKRKENEVKMPFR
jgi:hypothetical protein